VHARRENAGEETHFDSPRKLEIVFYINIASLCVVQRAFPVKRSNEYRNFHIGVSAAWLPRSRARFAFAAYYAGNIISPSRRPLVFLAISRARNRTTTLYVVIGKRIGFSYGVSPRTFSRGQAEKIAAELAGEIVERRICNQCKRCFISRIWMRSRAKAALAQAHALSERLAVL